MAESKKAKQDEPAKGADDEAPGEGGSSVDAAGLDEEMLRKISAVRARLREGFGVVVMGMMTLPRYRHQSLADLQLLVLEPLVRDRIAIAYPGKDESEADGGSGVPGRDITGMAIWASVSESVDAKIREQIRAGAFPVRLKPEEWTSGEINWLLDVIAPDPRTITAVIANFRQVVGQTELRLHPVVARMLDTETLEKLGVQRRGQDGGGAQPEASFKAAEDAKAASVTGKEAQTGERNKEPTRH